RAPSTHGRRPPIRTRGRAVVRRRALRSTDYGRLSAAQLASPDPTTVHVVPFAALHASELPAGPGGSKFSPRSWFPRSLGGQLPPGESPPQMPLLKACPLFRQSSSPMHAVIWSFVAVPLAHLALQSVKTSLYKEVPAQFLPPPLMMQFSAAEVS